MNPELPLRDIHLPDPIGFWPPAIGWWLLPVLGVLAIWGIRLAWRLASRPKVRRNFLTELKAIETADATNADKLRRLAILLRRAALTAHPAAAVAALTGEDWLAWLDQPLGDRRFREGPGRLLLDGPYRPTVDGDLASLFSLCRDWAKHLPKRRRT